MEAIFKAYTEIKSIIVEVDPKYELCIYGSAVNGLFDV